MAVREILAGSTSITIYVEILDSTSTTGGRKTGLAYNTSSLVAYYALNKAAAAAITLATQTVTGAYSSGGFVEVDATNMPGIYRLDLPNAAVATGPNVVVTLKGASGMVQYSVDIPLVAWNPYDGVRAGLTALPNAAAEAAGGLYTRGSGAGQINQSANGQVDSNVSRWLNTAVTAAVAGIPDVSMKYLFGTILAEGGAGRLAAAFNKFLDVASPVFTAISVNQGGDSYARLGAPAGASVSADVAATKALLPTALVGGRMDSNVGAQALANLTANVQQWSGTNVTTPITAGTPVVDWVPSGWRQNTAQAGAAGTITLDASASATDSFYKYSLIMILGGSGAGQARLCTAYVGSTKVATVVPNWTTNPSSSSVFATMPLSLADVEAWLSAAAPANTGDAFARLGAPVGASISADIAEVEGETDTILANTTGITFTVANQVDVNVVDWKGATAPAMTGDAYARLGAPAGASISADVAAVKTVVDENGADTDELITTIGVAGLGLSAIPDEAGVTTLLARLTAQRAGSLDALRSYSGTASAGGATTITLAGGVATDNYYNNQLVAITGGTGAGQARFITAYVGSTKVATVAAWATNPDNTSTFTVIPFDAVAGASAPTVAQIATGIWQDLLASSDFGTASSIGALLKADIDAAISSRSSYAGGDTSGTTTLLTRIPGTVQPQTGDSYARLGAPVGASISADIAEIEGETDDIASIKTQTDKLAFTVANQVDANVIDWKGATAPAMTGDAYARLGAPAGASISADIAEIEAETDDIAAVKAKTDNLPAAPAAVSDIPTANANADALLDRAAGIETGYTLRQTMRLMASVLLGKLSGAATTTNTFRDLTDAKNRVTATVDSDGNRTAVTKDAT